jgi:hypothetical protein
LYELLKGVLKRQVGETSTARRWRGLAFQDAGDEFLLPPLRFLPVARSK